MTRQRASAYRPCITPTPKTVKAVLDSADGYLRGKPVADPRLACELLLARLLQCKRLELSLRYDQALAEPQLAAMRRGTKRLAAGEPIQYILGRTSFMGHGLKVDRRALPAPERSVADGGFVAPRSPAEEVLAALWCEVLGIERAQ